MTRPCVCPFCALHCLIKKPPQNKKKFDISQINCEIAGNFLSAFQLDDEKQPFALLNKNKMTIEKAVDLAAEILNNSDAPFFGGAGVDVIGSREIITLARKKKAFVDHMHSESMSGSLRSLQMKGNFFTTLSELKSRSDLTIFLKKLPLERLPRFLQETHLDRERNNLRKKTIVLGGDYNSKSEFLSYLREFLLFLKTSTSNSYMKEFLELGSEIKKANYIVFVWDPGEFGSFAEHVANTVFEIVKEINIENRAGSIALGSDDGGTSFQNTLSWITGKSIRSRLGLKNSEFDYQPELNTLSNCISSGSIDSVLWFSCFSNSLPKEKVVNFPLIIFGNLSLRNLLIEKSPISNETLFFPVATPGVNCEGFITRCDGVVTLPLTKMVKDNLPSLGEVLGKISKKLRV